VKQLPKPVPSPRKKVMKEPDFPPSEYDLSSCGIDASVRIVGKLKVLRPGIDVPVVFLIDERHVDDCIDQNLVTAQELIQNCRISFVGVESLYGGCEWDDRSHMYTDYFNDGCGLDLANEYPKFGDEIRNSGSRVLGVECYGLSSELMIDLADNPIPPPIKDRHYNLMRSEHFIRTLFQLRSYHQMNGNMILNVGGNHNAHIENWINDQTIDMKVECKAAYVRLSAPACPCDL
jgi:hypothetical protein